MTLEEEMKLILNWDHKLNKKKKYDSLEKIQH